MGLDENKLYEITIDEYIERHPELKDCPKDLQNKRFEQFNIKRKKAIQDAKNLRIDMILNKKKEKKKKSKSFFDLDNIDTYLSIENDDKSYSNIRKQIKNMLEYELNQEENKRKNYEKHLEIEKNKKKIEEEKKELDELKKLKYDTLLELIEKNQQKKYLKLNEKHKEIIKNEEERIKRLELKKIDDLEEIKRLANERNEKARKVYEKNQLLYEIKRRELLELEERLKRKNIEIIEEVEPWKKEEEGERNRLKALLRNIQNEMSTKSKSELNNKINLKLIRMKKEKEDILKNKTLELLDKMKIKEERSLENMKKNAELEEMRIKKIKEKNLKKEENVKKMENLKNLESKNKFLYLRLIREDNMDNLKRIEKKKEIEREKIILKILDKDKRTLEVKDHRRKINERIVIKNKELKAKKSLIFDRACMALKSGRYRNANEILSKIFNDDDNSTTVMKSNNQTENK